MAKKPTVKMNITELKVIQTALKKMADGNFHIQVGIFGEKAGRSTASQGVTNAEIGFVHEMGSIARNIPRRSFLWDTFMYRGKKLMNSLKNDCRTLFKTGKVEAYLKRCGIEATNLVVEAFETSGWGRWAPLAYGTVMGKVKGSLVVRKQQAAETIHEGKRHTKPLIDTGQLWQSITSRIAK